MLGFQTYWEPLVISADAVIVFLLYRAYKAKGKEADLIHETPTFEVGSELQSAVDASLLKALDYVCIQGVTTVAGEPLKSQFTDEVGVIQHHLLVEHKSKRTQGSWSDFRRIIRNVFNYRPFYIVNPEPESGNHHKVEVSDIMAAEYLNDYLPVVHDKYTPVKDSLLSRGMDLMFGEVTKGYQDTEKILSVGAPILGVGSVLSEGKRLILRPPSDGRRYIITTLSKPELVRSMRSNAKTFKILIWIFVIVGAGVAGYSLYKFVQRRLQERESRRATEEFRRMRESWQDARGNDSVEEERNRCIVCIGNPREVVILNCGHVCLCSSCAEALPEPKMCPVCRSKVVRCVPVYVS